MSEASAVPTGRAYLERKVSTRDGLGLYVRDYGSPPSNRMPLLCLPGFTRNSSDFHEIALRYARQRRVICPDLRGRGRSDRDPDSAHYAPTVILEDVLDLVDALGVHRAVLLGASFGGFLAMGLGAARPRLLAGVILNDVGPEVDRREIAKMAGFIAENKPQPDWRTAARYARSLLGQDWDRQDEATWLKLARQSYSEGPDGKLHLDYDPAVGRPLQEMMRSRREWADLWRMFRALRHVPTLVLRGERSRILTAQTLARMTEEKPDLLVAHVPGIGHMPLLDEPESLEAIDAFLARF